jgi:hypothetical protein
MWTDVAALPNFHGDYLEIKQALRKLGVTIADKAVGCSTFNDDDGLYLYACQLRADGIWHCVVFDGRRRLLYDPLKSSPVNASPLELRRRYRPFSRLRIVRTWS